MLPQVSDVQITALQGIMVAIITIIPATLAAFWAREAKRNSAETAAEVRTNGGMSDPNPNVNDHIKYQTEMMEQLIARQSDLEKIVTNHISIQAVMNQALAEVYLHVRPEVKLPFRFDDNQNPD